jgi:two-component system response regulator MprA
VRPSVLVVDDDPLVREFLYDLLDTEGYAVRCAADGLDALRSVLADPPDLVLTDLMMRGLDGFGLITRIRERGLTVPVVAMSAHRFGLPREVPFVAKPFDLALLFATLTDALRRGPVVPDPRDPQDQANP